MIYLTNNSCHLLISSSARQHRLSPHYCVRKYVSLSSFTDKVQITSASCPSAGVSWDVSGGAWIQIQAYLTPKFYASSQCAVIQFHGPCLCDSSASSTNYVDFLWFPLGLFGISLFQFFKLYLSEVKRNSRGVYPGLELQNWNHTCKEV